MEPPSATPRRRLVHWLGSLLTVSLLIFWSPSITAQPTIESVPFNAAEGNDVLLLLRNPPTDTLIYIWYKGESRDHNNRIASYLTGATQPNATGPAHSGQETIYPNGSLLFQNVTLEDTGIYTLQITKTNGDNEALAGQIRVHPELPKPFITSNSSNPVEDQDSVTLTCDPETQNTTYQWLINHQSLPDRARLELSTDNRILTIYNVTRNDKGPYECETWNPVNARRSDPFILNVLYGPDTPTISPSDWHYPPGANLTLSCNAISNPPAQYSWLISGNYLQSTQVLFIPNVTVSDGGSYICHVRSNATGLSRTTVKTITVSGKWLPGTSALGSGVGVSLVFLKKFWKKLFSHLCPQVTHKSQNLSLSPPSTSLETVPSSYSSYFSEQTLGPAWNVGRGPSQAQKAPWNGRGLQSGGGKKCPQGQVFSLY
ncbi:cell adhesion molecule CEACAM6-like isoform 2-T2 [Trichechus inunguis]